MIVSWSSFWSRKMNVVVISALTDRSLLVYSHTGMIVWVLVSLLLFFVVCQWAMIKLCNNNTALHSSLEWAAWSSSCTTYCLPVFFFSKNYFHVAKVAIIHRKHVKKSDDHLSWGLVKYGYKPKFFKEQFSNHPTNFLTYTMKTKYNQIFNLPSIFLAIEWKPK